MAVNEYDNETFFEESYDVGIQKRNGYLKTSGF